MEKLKYLNDKDLWMLGEEIPNCDFFFSQIWLSNFVNEFKRFTGRVYRKILCVYRGYHLWFYFGNKDSFEVGENIVQKIIRNPKFVEQVNREIIIWSDKLRNCASAIPQDNLSKLSNQALWKFYAGHDKIHTDYYCWGWIPVAADMFHNNLTNRLKEYLRTKNITEEKINEYLVILTQPTKKSLIQIEQEELIKIGIVVQRDKDQVGLFKELFKNFKESGVKEYRFKIHSKEYEKLFEQRVKKIRDKISPKIYKLLEKHYLKYFYTKYLFTEKQGVYKFDHYLKELVRLVASEDLNKKYQEIQKEFKDGLRRRNVLTKKIKIKGGWKKIFNAFGDFMVTKIYRRYAQIFALYQMEAILREIGRRIDFSLMQIKFMLPQEVGIALLKGKVNKKEIKERAKFCVYYAEKGKDVISIGEKAEKLAEAAGEITAEKVSEIKGQCGCVGKVKGEVKIINNPSEMYKMEQGDILVSLATQPDLVPAMRKAAAIVTDQGGVTSHAAIVARELHIPCVIGTKIATKVLKDGDFVEVDANHGVVKIIK